MSLPIDQQIVHAWEIHNRITLALIDGLPEGGFQAVPLASRGRTVARQLAHMNAVRTGWLHYHQTGKHPTRPDKDKAAEPTREQLRQAFIESGEAVAG